MSSASLTGLNPDFDREGFLRDYWQQKPLLIKNLLPGFEDLLEAEELAGLACEQSIESRLVTGTGKTLQLRHGPFTEQDFTSLPARDYTLLVQAVDQWVEEVAGLRQCFDFLPNWRVEDIMISYATPGGGVGPHFDYYDVFLIQGSGKRRWQLGQLCDAATVCENRAGLSILREFKEQQSWDLEPGDALYLPPRYAHWGTAVESGLCYSLGLRSPSLAEMLEGFSDTLIDKADPGDRFVDPAPAMPRHPAEIQAEALIPAYQHLLQTLQQPAEFQRWFGCQVTAPRYPEQILAPAQHWDQQSLSRALAAGAEVLRHPGARFAYLLPPGGDQVLCFVNGEAFTLPGSDLHIVQNLCDLTIENTSEICSQLLQGHGAELVLNLVNEGALVLELE